MPMDRFNNEVDSILLRRLGVGGKPVGRRNQLIGTRLGACVSTHIINRFTKQLFFVKPIFDSQRRFLLERSSSGAALRAIEVFPSRKCSAISSVVYRF